MLDDRFRQAGLVGTTGKIVEHIDRFGISDNRGGDLQIQRVQ